MKLCFGALVALLVLCGALWLSSPAAGGTCYSNCEIAYWECVATGGTNCEGQLSLCTLQCGGSSGGGDGGDGGRGGRSPAYTECVASCFDDLEQCLVSGPPPGSTGSCTEILDQCRSTCALVHS